MTSLMMASEPATSFWRQRGARDWANVLPTYWAATAQPHRHSLIEALKQLLPFQDARELGCCAGTNLALLRQAFPSVAAEGVELSVEAATYAQDQLKADPGVRIVCADMLQDAATWPDGDVDVTFSCYALAYIAPEDLPGLLVHMLRASRVGVALVEPMYGHYGRLPAVTVEWRHDYVQALDRALATLRRPAQIAASKLPTPVEACDGVVIVRLQ